jgi:hypothetical protein
MLEPHASPICRLPSCPLFAPVRGGFCTPHGLRYLRWRIWRDALERQDLLDAGVLPGHSPDPLTAAALDVLYAWLTPGPFPELDADDLLAVPALAGLAAAPLRPR